MLKKLSIVLALSAVLGLALAAPVASDAKEKKKTVVVVAPKKKVVVVKKPVHTKTVYVVGQSYNGHLYVGRKRHRWHGVWYAYGVGPCWINIGGVWFWNVAGCP